MSATPASQSAAAAAAMEAALATMLSLPPPPGQTVNLVDPPTQQAAIIAVCTATLFLTVLIVSLRSYANFFINRSKGYEDC